MGQWIWFAVMFSSAIYCWLFTALWMSGSVDDDNHVFWKWLLAACVIVLVVGFIRFK